jgi:hypothetical protein
MSNGMIVFARSKQKYEENLGETAYGAQCKTYAYFTPSSDLKKLENI